MQPNEQSELNQALDRLEGLERAATCGPWAPQDERPECLIEAGVYSGGVRILGAIAPLKRLSGYKNANVQLTAALRNAAPGLIALVRKQAELIAAMAVYQLRLRQIAYAGVPSVRNFAHKVIDQEDLAGQVERAAGAYDAALAAFLEGSR